MNGYEYALAFFTFRPLIQQFANIHTVEPKLVGAAEIDSKFLIQRLNFTNEAGFIVGFFLGYLSIATTLFDTSFWKGPSRSTTGSDESNLGLVFVRNG